MSAAFRRALADAALAFVDACADAVEAEIRRSVPVAGNAEPPEAERPRSLKRELKELKLTEIDIARARKRLAMKGISLP